jgi:predicted RecB family nuclease
MKITNEILDAIIHCNHKAFLKKVQGNQFPETEFQTVFEKLKQNQISAIQPKLSLDTNFQNIGYSSNLKFEKGKTYLQISFKNSEVDLNLDGIYYDHKNSFTPIFISPFEKIQKSDKLFIALQSHYLKHNFNLKIEDAKIMFGSQQKSTKVILSNLSKDVKKTIATIEQIQKFETAPIFYKINHCQVCEFNPICRKKLQDRDDLSLLGNLKSKEIEQKNNRGIFSVKQLSYTFRPKKNPYQRRKSLPELKALAIREQKVFIQKLPELEKKETEIFFDIEGIPDRDFYYLIGIIIKTENSKKEYSFWADDISEQQDIFIQFIDLLNTQNDFVLYHYGSYEMQALKRIANKLPLPYQNGIKKIIENSFNVLTFFSNDIYTPTYTNGLKDIANYLEFYWRDEKASGNQSIIWRYNWELTPTSNLKERLTTYNIEDCRALMKVQQWLTTTFDTPNEKIQNIANIKSDSYHKWGNTKFELSALDEINKYAHFDYQQQKILLKSNKAVKKAVKKKSLVQKQKNKIDKTILLYPEVCPVCHQASANFELVKRGEMVKVDIKHTKNGIRKMVTLYKGGQYKCYHCKKVFSPQKLKKGPVYGDNLIAWAINLQIQYNISGAKTIDIIKDSFNIQVSATKMWDFKPYMANKYKETYDEIISKIVSGNLLHIDETKSSIKDVPSGYVWVFTNMDSVFYIFKQNREADFLKDMLSNFKGVLVSDFYTGYDAIHCPQQKCLIHLIRDLNNDLLKNQFNIDFKNFVSNFSDLLQKIIGTVNKYGLKKRNLNKHNKDVSRFYSHYIDKKSDNELLLSYQIRLQKNRDKLFTFLNHDGIPWNNNNAEHAIKPFAYYRRDNEKQITELGITDYLILLSIQQTCKYRGINFFEFLKSGEKSIYEYSEK